MESRKMVEMNLSAGQERDADIENGRADAAGAGEGGTDSESSIHVYTTRCKRAGGKPLWSKGGSAGAL